MRTLPFLFWLERILFLSRMVDWKLYLGPGLTVEKLFFIFCPIWMCIEDFDFWGLYLSGPGKATVELLKTEFALHSFLYILLLISQGQTQCP